MWPTEENTENAAPEGAEQEMSTEIRFEISAERYGYDDDEYDHHEETLPQKAVGTIRAVTAEAARWALGAAISMFLEKRMRKDEE